jgi:hypothetical protein
MEIMLTGLKCERCGYEWKPRKKKEEIRICPKCKSPYWNRARRVSGKREVREGGLNGGFINQDFTPRKKKKQINVAKP